MRDEFLAEFSNRPRRVRLSVALWRAATSLINTVEIVGEDHIWILNTAGLNHSDINRLRANLCAKDGRASRNAVSELADRTTIKRSAANA